MPAEKKERWNNHKDNFRPLTRRNECVVGDVPEDRDVSGWKIMNPFLATPESGIPSSMIRNDDFKVVGCISHSVESPFARLMQEDDIVNFPKNESSSRHLVIIVHGHGSKSQYPWDANWSKSSPCDEATGFVRISKQKILSNVLWICPQHGGMSSELPTATHKIPYETASTYENYWLRWTTREQLPQQHSTFFAAEKTETYNLNWIHNSEEILQRLENPRSAETDQIAAVLFAETTAFELREISRLLEALSLFISKHRFSSDENTTTALGSAIRKYAMNMSEELFGPYSEWLLPSSTDTLGHQLELELTKAFNWRLSYRPITAHGFHASVLRNFVDVCNSYLHRRIILQKNYASTVLHGLSVVAILEASSGQRENTDLMFKVATDMQLNWFSELLCDRLGDTIDSIREHSPDLATRISEMTSKYLRKYEGSGNALVDTLS